MNKSTRGENVVAPLDKTDSLATGAAQLLEPVGAKDSEGGPCERQEKWRRSPPLRPSGASQSIPTEDDLEAAYLHFLMGAVGSRSRGRIDRLRHVWVYQCDSLRWARSTEQL
jgi:hypothetical protein